MSMATLPPHHREASFTSSSTSHPLTPARNTGINKEGNKVDCAVDRSDPDRLGAVGDERSSPMGSGSGGRTRQPRMSTDDQDFVRCSLLQSVDKLVSEDGSYRVPTAPGIGNLPSPQHHILNDSSLPSLGGDSTTFDNSESFGTDEGGQGLNSYHQLAFSPLRMDQRRGKPQSSPGAKPFLGGASSFFDDLVGSHTASMAPLESTPRKVTPSTATMHPNTLLRAQMQHRKTNPTNDSRHDDSSSGLPQSPAASSDSHLGKASSPRKTTNEAPSLQNQLSASQVDRAELQERYDTQSLELATLRDAFQHMAFPQPYQYLPPHLATFNQGVSNASWGSNSPALGGTRSLYRPSDSGASAWAGRHSPAISDMRSCEGSPSMGYVGLSLINSIQAQLQAGIESHSPSPEPFYEGRAGQSASDSSFTSYPGPAATARRSKQDEQTVSEPTALNSGSPPSHSTAVPRFGATSSRVDTATPVRQTAPAQRLSSPATPTLHLPQGGQPPWLAQYNHMGAQSGTPLSPIPGSPINYGGERSLAEFANLQEAARNHQQLFQYAQAPLQQYSPAPPSKPRYSTPAGAMPYMSVGLFNGGSTPCSGVMSPNGIPSGRSRGLDSMTPPEVLVARALSGRSQEASIILQQQLKSGSTERQAAIVRAITPHLLVLSEDKHGNFLVQRAIGINSSVAWKLKASYARLALSQYGCHVVQRILDEDEPLKMAVVEELLSQNLLETLTSRNSVHVWAKALEVKWSSDKFREKVFDVINAAMRGHWAYTAMQETGSIVVQNLFESAQGPEKKDCIDEILHKLPECAANQWGVWVVQHIIEHGDDDSRVIAFEKLLGEAAMLSMSQFGQKAIMTALKSRDANFIGGYLDLLCDGPNASGSGGEGSGQGAAASTSGSSGRRSMLVDIASTPQGLQIMTQLLTTISRDDRERIIKAVRKNSVFLKGTKTGLKVHQMCERARAFTGY